MNDLIKTITDNAAAIIAGHAAQLDKNSNCLVAAGWLVAGADRRLLTTDNNKQALIVWHHSSDDLSGIMHFTRESAEKWAAEMSAKVEPMQAIRVNDWHREQIANAQRVVALAERMAQAAGELPIAE